MPPEITMSFRIQLTNLFAKLFPPKDNAAYSQPSDVNADPNLPNSQSNNNSAPEIMAMGLRRIPRNSQRPQGRRGRAGSW